LPVVVNIWSFASPVISAAALDRMSSLKEDSDIDNVLLEWLIMVELQAKV